MKIFLFLIGIVAAGIVGYSFEPQMRYALTGKAEDYVPPKKPETVKKVLVDAEPAKKAIDPATWPADKLPEKVTLKGEAEIANESGDIKMPIPAGSKVNLVRIEGENVIISPGPGPFEGVVAIAKTDLLEQLTILAEILPPTETDPVEPPVVATNTGVEPEVPDTTPEVAVVEPDETDPPAVDPEPVVPEVAVNEPAEEPSGEPTSPPSVSGDVVAVMQSSIKNNEIQEFTFDQVLEWTANDEVEEIEGEKFQTGIASYKADTVFGVKTIQAKALIQDGKVVRWLWPKSGMEIK